MQGGGGGKTAPKGPGHLKKPSLWSSGSQWTVCPHCSRGTFLQLAGLWGSHRRRGGWGGTPSHGLGLQVPLPIYPSEKCVCVPLSVLPHHPPTFQPRAGGGQQTQSPLCMGWYVSPTLHMEDTMPLLLPVLPLPTTSQSHMPGCNWLLAQDSPLIPRPRGILSRFQEPLLSSLSPTLPAPQPAWALACPSYGSWGTLAQPQPSPGCAALLFCG